MSRCFPFPPPGYEKKARTDTPDILTKEKHKEKKHRKDKKDKEKREGKDKKDKEKSREKHKEKKDRKEKHKDKKDKDRDKDKRRTSDEKTNKGQPEHYHGELRKNGQSFEGSQDFKFIQELCRRIRDEECETGNQTVENFIGSDQRGVDGMGRVLEKDIGNWTEGEEKHQDKSADDRKENGQRNRDKERDLGNATVQNFSEIDQRRVDAVARPMEKDAGKMGGKGKNKDKQMEKPNEKDREKKSKSKDKDRGKQKERDEKRKHKNKEQDKLLESVKKGPKDVPNVKPSELPKDYKAADSEGILGKRKNFNANGFLDDNEIRPNKMARPASSFHLLTENGRNLQPCQTANQFDLEGVANNCKVDNKEQKINGIIQAQPSVYLSRSSLATLQAKENGEGSTKPPHPDSKYLSRILSVPKMDEWSDFDDQEWLFSSDDFRSKKPNKGFSGDDKEPQVWSKALRIESADICALPYVIPH